MTPGDGGHHMHTMVFHLMVDLAWAAIMDTGTLDLITYTAQEDMTMAD